MANHRLRAASFDTSGGVGSTFDTGVYQVALRFDEVRTCVTVHSSLYILKHLFIVRGYSYHFCLYTGVPFADDWQLIFPIILQRQFGSNIKN